MGDRHDAVVATNVETGSTGTLEQLHMQTLLPERTAGWVGSVFDLGSANECRPVVDAESHFYDVSQSNCG